MRLCGKKSNPAQELSIYVIRKIHNLTHPHNKSPYCLKTLYHKLIVRIMADKPGKMLPAQRNSVLSHVQHVVTESKGRFTFAGK